MLDATQIGIFFFLVFIFPGFLGWRTFRWVAGSRGPVGEIGSLCYAFLFGVGSLSLWEWSKKNEVAEITKILSNPLSAAVILSGVSIIFSFLLGLIVGWVRNKFR